MILNYFSYNCLKIGSDYFSKKFELDFKIIKFIKKLNFKIFDPFSTLSVNKNIFQSSLTATPFF